MDLHEWEILPDDGLLDFKEDEKIITGSRKTPSDAKIAINMDYFFCPPPDSGKISRSPGAPKMPKQPVPVAIQLDSPFVRVPDTDELLIPKEKSKVPAEISVLPPTIGAKDQMEAGEGDQEMVTQVFFKKMKENEFVDMKVDSPRTSNKGTKPQIDVGNYQFVDEGEALETIANSPKKKLAADKTNMENVSKDQVNWDRSSNGLNILKWSLNGIGAICSFGVAAVTVCILFYGGQHQSDKPHQQHKKLRFQIYTDDKKLNQVVQQATRLNEAISAVAGVPLTRAHITCGGYYDGLQRS